MQINQLSQVLDECRFEDILDSLPLAIFIKDTQRRHVWCNRKFQEITGLDRDTQLGEVAITTLSPEHQRIARQSDTAILSGESGFTYDYRMTCPCGKSIDTRFLKIPARNPKNEIVGIIGIAIDTTHDCETVRALMKNVNHLMDEKGLLERHASDLQTSLAFTEEQAGQMAELAEEIEVQRQSIAEQNVKIKRLMYLDENTGVHNRRYFFDFAHEALGARDNCTDKGVIAMLDIDKFKTVNDTYGHAGGDAALKTFANTVKDMLPDLSLFCRFGGEEFVIITPCMPTEYGVRLIDKVRKAVAETACQHNDVTFSFTVSAGITEIAEDISLDAMLHRADEALYTAKDNGRNQVVLYQPEPTDENAVAPEKVTIEA